jgi:hypothetical protein
MALKQVISKLTVEIEPDRYTQDMADRQMYLRGGDPAKAERILKDWAKQFEEFLRDHRSQDVNGLTVVKHYEYRCEFCGDESEYPDVRPECCDRAIAEWDPESGAV